MKNSKMLHIALAALLYSLLGYAQAAVTTLYVDSANVTRGSISNQGLAVLDDLEQSGYQDSWSTYIEAAPDSARFSGEFIFFYTPSSGTEVVEQITVKTNTLGETINNQRWFFQIRNFADGSWELLGDNDNANSWMWFQRVFSITTNATDYINSNGKIRIRYRSNNSYDISNIDHLVVEVTAEENGGGTGNWWQPSPNDNLTWQWQINGTLDTSFDVDMYDVDLFDTSINDIQTLQSVGRVVVCYFSAGTYEGWRPDWQNFFPFITGES